MNKKILQSELEDALNNLDISYTSKKTFFRTLPQNNDSFAIGYFPIVCGTLSLIAFFIFLYLHMSRAEGWSVSPVILMLQINMATLCLTDGFHKIKDIKMNRSVIELIIKANQNLEPIVPTPAESGSAQTTQAHV
ncbi:hypothetical protein P4E94_19535 [Pontiellaceae bacterium B12219]|nr:hypothetical protein [Pontiellaceae bacterium B12219]